MITKLLFLSTVCSNRLLPNFINYFIFIFKRVLNQFRRINSEFCSAWRRVGCWQGIVAWSSIVSSSNSRAIVLTWLGAAPVSFGDGVVVTSGDGAMVSSGGSSMHRSPWCGAELRRGTNGGAGRLASSTVAPVAPAAAGAFPTRVPVLWGRSNPIACDSMGSVPIREFGRL